MSALGLHGTVLGMVPWPREEALSERSAGEQAEVWGAPTSTVMIELATVETIAGDAAEAAETRAEEVHEAANSEIEPAESELVETELVETELVETELVQTEAGEPSAATAIDPLSPLEPVEEVRETVEASAPVPVPDPKPTIAAAKAKVAAKPMPAEPEPRQSKKREPTLQKAAQVRNNGRSNASAGNAKVSASAASGIARGNRGMRQAEAGWSNRSNYAGRIVAHLQRHKHYPETAARNGTTGVATLTFSISASGRLTAVRLRGSSGASILDQAALDTVRRASPFPPIPSEAGVSTMTFTVPLRYKRQ